MLPLVTDRLDEIARRLVELREIAEADGEAMLSYLIALAEDECRLETDKRRPGRKRDRH